MIAAHLKIHPGQDELTPEQQAEGRRFLDARIAVQLATGPVNEAEAEDWLRRTYQMAGASPPRRIRWVDGPLHFISHLLPETVWEGIQRPMAEEEWNAVARRVWDQVSGYFSLGEDGMFYFLTDGIKTEMETAGETLWQYVECLPLRGEVFYGPPTIRNSVWESFQSGPWKHVLDALYDFEFGSDQTGPGRAGMDWCRTSLLSDLPEIVDASVQAYARASELLRLDFLALYMQPNRAYTFARFNELVSGYALGEAQALLVRKPHRLRWDEAGRLHSATGKCIEYRDGWGGYAWHGVPVPEHVILHPERLTREAYLREPNVEVRRVMQERMGERFVQELGGQVIDHGPRGTLYEVSLPLNDPERVARYVQVQDASTPRQYVLRVPPHIQTAAEAVAWTFQLTAKTYGPAHET